MDAPPAKFKLTGGNISPTLINHKVDYNEFFGCLKMTNAAFAMEENLKVL